jgi:uncharacterized membrane protein
LGQADEEDEMDLKKLTDRAKDLVDKRGGTESLKEDADELKGIAGSKGSLADKAKAAVAAIKDPGDDDATAAPETEPAPAPEATAPRAEGAGAESKGEHRGRHGHGGHGRGGQGRGRQGGRDGDPAV